jgi:hypothetical protein
MLNSKQSKTLEFIFRDIHILGLSGIPTGDLCGQKIYRHPSRVVLMRVYRLDRFQFLQLQLNAMSPNQFTHDDHQPQ